ncbi:uncharacterized protein LOC118143604 [Callithrix jacchus]
MAMLPRSSNSSLLTKSCWKACREARMEPPVHAEVFLWGLAATAGLSPGQRRLSSLWKCSGKPSMGGLEKHLGAAETLLADGDELAVWELVVHAQLLREQGELLPRQQGGKAALLFDVLYDVQVVVRECVARLVEQLHQVVGEVTPSVVGAAGQARQHVRDAVTALHHEPRGLALPVNGQQRLGRHVHGTDAKGLEHELSVLLPVAAGAERRVRDQHSVLLGDDLHGPVEDVLPDVLHAVPVHHDAVLQRVHQLERRLCAQQLMAHQGLLAGVTGVGRLGAAFAHGGGDEVGGPRLSRIAALAVLGAQVDDHLDLVHLPGLHLELSGRTCVLEAGVRAWQHSRLSRVTLSRAQGHGAKAVPCRHLPS